MLEKRNIMIIQVLTALDLILIIAIDISYIFDVFRK
jgi:hypothetical protein